MEFPVTGLIILVAAIWFFFFKSRLLYAAMIVSIPFSATAVVNFPWGGGMYGGTKSIMAWQLLAVFWFLRETTSSLPHWRRRGWFLTRNPRTWLLAFTAALIASLSVPLIFNGTAWISSWVVSPDYRGDTVLPLRFTAFNVTQSLYIVFGVLLTVFVAAENWHPKRLFYTLRLYVSSCVFAAAWGLYNFWCNVSGHAYASQVFNTSKNFAATGYTETITTGSLLVGRISSVALEPSDLAEELLFSFVVLLVCLELGRPILRRGWNWLGLALLTIILLVSTSSTAYFGILGAVILTVVVLVRSRNKRWKPLLGVAIVILTVITLLVIVVPSVNQVAQFSIASKYVTGSGYTRMESVQIAAKSFLRFPILGAGWPDVQVWDVAFLLLANTGLIGFFAFASFLLSIFCRLWKLAKRQYPLAVVIFPAILLAMVLEEGKGLTYGPGYIWLYLGLSVGAAAAAKLDHLLDFATPREHLGSYTIQVETT